MNFIYLYKLKFKNSRIEPFVANTERSPDASEFRKIFSQSKIKQKNCVYISI